MQQELLKPGAVQLGSMKRDEHDKKSHVAIFFGGTHVPEENVTAFTIGIDLEREINRHFGVGLVVEHAFEEVGATAVLGVMDVHLGRGFVVQVGPGVEWIDGEAFALGRVGLFYEIEVGEMVVSPSFSYDISQAADSVVFGVALGTKF